MKLRDATKKRDRFVVAGRSVGMIGVFSLASTLLVAHVLEATARACSQIGPGIFERSVWPGPENPVSTNTRLMVTYSLGVDTTIPPFGEDLVLLDADGTTIPAAIDVTMMAALVHVQLRPVAPLLPNHSYHLADRRLVPCDALQGACTLAGAPQPFASFTTGAEPDVTPPAFAGVSSIGVANHLTCDNGGCCGSYDVHLVDVSWQPASDDVIKADVRYNVYRREGTSLTLVAGFVGGTAMHGVRTCSGTWNAPEVKPGSYVVRAVDASGNEDSNTIERDLGELCASGCSAGGPIRDDGLPAWLVAASVLALVGAIGLRPRLARARRRPLRS